MLLIWVVSEPARSRFAPASARPVEHSFYSSISGRAGACWAYRRHFNTSESDPYRTSFHWQPSANWMNDPNGPMYANGLYHLFFQYNPYGTEGFAHIHTPHRFTAALNERLPKIRRAPKRDSLTMVYLFCS